MTEPQPYGLFHLCWFAASILAGIGLCIWHRKNGSTRRVLAVVLGTAITVIVLEIYKIINFGFSYDDGIRFEFEWYAFPWQFCSTPMYVGLLAGLIRKGKIHDCLCAYLATYAMFAGLIVMILPTDVFMECIGINVQTMICHGSMIMVSIYLLYSGHVKVEHKTILKAMPVFVVTLGVAMILNEVAYRSGLLESHDFNMFYISPYQDPHLPVFSVIQPLVPYVVSLALYAGVFTLAAYVVLLAAMGIRRLSLGKKKGLPV